MRAQTKWEGPARSTLRKFMLRQVWVTIAFSHPDESRPVSTPSATLVTRRHDTSKVSVFKPLAGQRAPGQIHIVTSVH